MKTKSILIPLIVAALCAAETVGVIKCCRLRK